MNNIQNKIREYFDRHCIYTYLRDVNEYYAKIKIKYNSGDVKYIGIKDLMQVVNLCYFLKDLESLFIFIKPVNVTNIKNITIKTSHWKMKIDVIDDDLLILVKYKEYINQN